ncbi:hypothetical protein ABIC75_002290 [Dyella japonica]|uniref:Uncharacterized protein n=1 Tax=Dyella japonica TaxID=231455 RepID=A0ABV2JUN6_9GAMM
MTDRAASIDLRVGTDCSVGGYHRSRVDHDPDADCCSRSYFSAWVQDAHRTQAAIQTGIDRSATLRDITKRHHKTAIGTDPCIL